MERHRKQAMRSMKSGVVLAVAVAVLGGCAALDARPPEEVLKERAQQRWDAMVKSDFKAAYQFLSPGRAPPSTGWSAKGRMSVTR